MVKKLITRSLTCALLLLEVHPALARTDTGTIVGIHYNTLIPGGEVCVKTIPVAPRREFCVVQERRLSKEMNDFLRDAYISRKKCAFTWTNTTPDGFADVEGIECTE